MPTTAAPIPPLRRGACPGVLDPMESADGWLVRIRLPAGRITTGQLGVVAELAEGCGSGAVEFTSRANLQLRGVADPALERVGSRLVEVGLAAPDPATDARRAVVASPLAGHDPTEIVDVSSVVDAVLEALADAPLPPLPAKFGVVVDGGGHLGVRDVAGTICLGAVAVTHATAQWLVARDTNLAAGPIALLGALDTDALVDAVLAAATAASPEGRFRRPPAAVAELSGHSNGDAEPHERFWRSPAALAEPSGHPDGIASPPGRYRPPPQALHEVTARPTEAARSVGVLPHTMPRRSNVVARMFLGRAEARTLAAVAELATRALAVRTAPGGVALLGVADADVGTIVASLGALGLVVDDADGRAGITACIGAPGCAAARADTGVAAARLAATRRAPANAAVHLAACEKRCGAPLSATVLVAGERGHFDVDGAT